MGPRAHSPAKGFFKPRMSAGITYSDNWRSPVNCIDLLWAIVALVCFVLAMLASPF